MRISGDDLRYALRSLLRHRRFAVMATLTLGLAIGLNTTMYSVVDALVFPEVPIRSPERLITLQYYNTPYRKVDPAVYVDALTGGLTVAEGTTSFTRFGPAAHAVQGSHSADVIVSTVGQNFFDVLGTGAEMGRLFLPGDQRGDVRAAVISHRLWATLFPHHEPLNSATITFDGSVYSVIGVLPDKGEFPRYASVWVLGTSRTAQTNALVRERLGATRTELDRDLSLVAKRLAIVTGTDPHQTRFDALPAILQPFHFRGFHVAMIGAVLALLLVACANLASLQLARGIARTREMATRAALGASRGDLIGQLLLESGCLAVGGLIVGALLTGWGMHVVSALIPPGIEDYVQTPQLSWRVFAFALSISSVCLVLVGVLPATRLSRVDLHEALKVGAGTGTSRRGRQRYSMLVTAEVALSLALLACASLLIRAAWSAQTYDLGYAPDPLLFAITNIPRAGPTDSLSIRAHLVQAVARARSVAGVTDATVIHFDNPAGDAVTVDDPSGATVEHAMPQYAYRIVTPSFFRTVGVRIVQGRDFDATAGKEPTVIVDEVAAKAWWPHSSPVGRMIKLGGAHTNAPWRRVIGVSRRMKWLVHSVTWVDDKPDFVVLNSGDTARIRPAGQYAEMIVRTSTSPERVAMTLQRAFAGQAFRGGVGFQRLVDYDGLEVARRRQDFVAGLFIAFAILTLGLATFGIFAVVSQSVAQRTREFGVRIALGAGTGDILGLVLREGNVVTLGGIAIGLVLAIWGGQLLQAFLFGLDPIDPVIYALVIGVTFVASVGASLGPARRATQVDPVEALRNE